MARPTRRAFFALWPEPDEAAALQRYAAELPAGAARRVGAGALHLTLAFIGEVDAAGLSRLHAIGAQVDARGFELSLDQVGHWRHNRIAWVGCRQVPAALEALAQGLRSRLEAGGFAIERRPFRAHVTVLRKALELPAVARPNVIWRVREFVLACSTLRPEGARYELVGRFPLG